MSTTQACHPGGRETWNLDMDWLFLREDISNAGQPDFDDRAWAAVDLPHSFNHEKYEVVGNGWRGVGWYRKHFDVPARVRDRRVLLYFEGAMTVAETWINGIRLAAHHGGYTPFCHDITPYMQPGRDNLLAVRLDNRYQPEVPPERPDERPLGMAHSGGIYRGVKLIITDKLHVPPAVHSWDNGWREQGGVCIQWPEIRPDSATARIVVWIKNDRAQGVESVLTAELLDAELRPVGRAQSMPQRAAPGANLALEAQLTLQDPRLWFPWQPYLYTLRTQITADGVTVDGLDTSTGVRDCQWSRETGFTINGRRLKLLGVNRHQHFPFVGHAVPKNQQYLDALDIRNAGCNCVRHSHYLQHDAFMDACDALGLIAWVELPGWGTHGLNLAETSSIWRERNRDALRATIRHARNHPSIVIWGAGINEAPHDEEFETEMLELARAEDPTRPTSQARNYNTSNNIFDIYARNDYGALNTANPDPRTSGYLITEHSSPVRGKAQVPTQYPWRETANNMGWHHRDATEERFISALEHLADYLAYVFRHAWIAGAMMWEMYDHYTQFYSPRCHGISDAGRIPKWLYYLYQSQTAQNNYDGTTCPMIFIANYWRQQSPTRVLVLSNCEEVRISKWIDENWRIMATHRPEPGRPLPHPPCSFELQRHDTPRIMAEGLIGGEVRASHVVAEPGPAHALRLRANTVRLQPNGSDISLLTISAVDACGTLTPYAGNEVHCTLHGPGALIGENPARLLNGQFPILFQAGRAPGVSRITAKAADLQPAALAIHCFNS